MKVGVADYGMNVWYGGCFDVEARLDDLKAIGYEGLERIRGGTGDEILNKAAAFHRRGMDFATVATPDIDVSIRWAAALGKSYVWTAVSGKTFDVFCRQVNHMCEMCARWGISAALHNHLGTLVETQPQLEAFMEACPECKLIFDTAHLAAAGGDAVEIVRKYGDRIVIMHVKDWLLTNPEIGFETWWERGRFCELGAGNIGLDNAAVIQALRDIGYDGWLFVEHDTHLQDPLKDLAISRQYLRDCGV